MSTLGVERSSRANRTGRLPEERSLGLVHGDASERVAPALERHRVQERRQPELAVAVGERRLDDARVQRARPVGFRGHECPIDVRGPNRKRERPGAVGVGVERVDEQDAVGVDAVVRVQAPVASAVVGEPEAKFAECIRSVRATERNERSGRHALLDERLEVSVVVRRSIRAPLGRPLGGDGRLQVLEHRRHRFF